MNKVDKCLGQEIKISTFDAFQLSVTKYEPRQVIEAHYHEHPYYSMVLGGGYYEKNEFQSTPILSGALVKRPSAYVHENTFINNTSYCFNIEFLNWNTHYLFHEFLFGDYEINEGKNTNVQAWKVLAAFFMDAPVLQIEAVLMEVLAESKGFNLQDKHSPNVQGWLKRLEDYLQTHCEETTSLSHLSALVNISPIYMIRAFKKNYGMTIGEYHHRIRMNRALEAVLYSRKTISEIAQHFGYFDQSHFCRKFKSAFGVSPFHFRKNFQRFI